MLMILRSLALLALLATPANATCHKYKYWAFNYPQRCAYVHTNIQRSVMRVAQVPVPVPARPSPPDDPFDTRTAGQIREEAEHDAAIVYGHDELARELASSRALRDGPAH
jgi:hypothetical protein